jgi:two-component system LytT family response regulator
MTSEKYTYLVVENAIDVCEGIQRRMELFDQWESLGFCTTVKNAIERISDAKPNLIYLDWSLNGGSAFEVLKKIDQIPMYNPYIIFNTGFQSDNPEIPQEIINNFKVDKYLMKPFWETLRNNLPFYLKEAQTKADELKPKSVIIWIDDEKGARIPLPINKLICIVQHPEHPRKRYFYTTANDKEITVPFTWEECCQLLDQNSINYFITKNREHLVVKDSVEKFEKPFVRLKNLPFKIEVVKEKVKDFSRWLETK